MAIKQCGLVQKMIFLTLKTMWLSSKSAMIEAAKCSLFRFPSLFTAEATSYNDMNVAVSNRFRNRLRYKHIIAKLDYKQHMLRSKQVWCFYVHSLSIHKASGEHSFGFECKINRVTHCSQWPKQSRPAHGRGNTHTHTDSQTKPEKSFPRTENFQRRLAPCSYLYLHHTRRPCWTVAWGQLLLRLVCLLL